MRFELRPPGIHIDNSPLPCSVLFSTDGGGIRYDMQAKEDEDPTSELVYHYSGWEPRTVTLDLTISPGIGEEPYNSNMYNIIGRIFAASRSEQGVPPLHTLSGQEARAFGFESQQMIIEDMQIDRDDVANEVNLSIRFLELDPDVVDLRATPPPPNDNTPRGGNLTQSDEDRLAHLPVDALDELDRALGS